MRRLRIDHRVRALWPTIAAMAAVGIVLAGYAWRGGDVREGAADRTAAKPREATDLSEGERIERLLRIIERSDVTFIRNEVEYGGSQAAEHLRRKLEAAGAGRMTLGQFIEEIGSRSSMTGKAYQVRLADGTVMDAGPWMRRQSGEDSGSAKGGSEPQDR
jgi:hypothetical protein